MFVDLQLARLQCDAAELTDSWTSDSVVCGCTIFGAEAAGGMTRGYREIRSFLRSQMKCWQVGQGWGREREMSGHAAFVFSKGKNNNGHGSWFVVRGGCTI